ncbi:MAG: hypothetical protein OEZ16_11305 [Chromatiales bacterium]|nr:hypothetical protein [Chromatiales bacterium]
MPVKYTPILSLDQQQGREDCPLPYMTNIAGPLANLQSDLHWHMHDLSRFQQVVLGDLNERNVEFEKQYQLFQESVKKALSSVSDEDEMETLNYQTSRTGSYFINQGLVIDRCKAFSDEFCVIGLWATAEKFLGKVYAHIESYQSGGNIDDVNAPYRWDIIEAKYIEKNIHLNQLPGYADADECRVLNNTIKHAGYVNQRLAQFPFFTQYQGTELTNIQYEMQRYYNGIWEFLGSLIESGNRVVDPSFPY